MLAKVTFGCKVKSGVLVGSRGASAAKAGHLWDIWRHGLKPCPFKAPVLKCGLPKHEGIQSNPECGLTKSRMEPKHPYDLLNPTVLE